LLKDFLLPDDSGNKTARKNHIDNFSSQQWNSFRWKFFFIYLYL
jgi:hypothetical protein